MIMIVDPATRRVVCPRQEISYRIGDRIEKLPFGPIVLGDFPDNNRDTTAVVAPTHQSSGCFDISLATSASRVSEAGSNGSSNSSVGTASGADTGVESPVTPVPPVPSTLSSLFSAATRTPPSFDQSPFLPHNGTEQRRGLPSAHAAGPLGPDNVREILRPEPPVRALSAYNFFFRDERERILNGDGDGGNRDFSPSRRARLLSEHWNRDRSRKRRHRKTHGRFGFTELSRLISKGWRELPEDGREFYRKIAADDFDRYRTELRAYKKLHEAPFAFPFGGGGGGGTAAPLMNDGGDNNNNGAVAFDPTAYQGIVA